VCIRASANTARNAHVKIIFEQTAKEGVSALETIDNFINTSTTTASTTYVAQNYLQLFGPENYAGGTFTYFFEATSKESTGTPCASAYTDLFNITDASQITEVSTVSTSYIRTRSASLTMPSADKTLDSRIKDDCANLSNTTANSWLIIQASALPTVPTTDQQLKHGDWFSTGGVRQSFTF
jgi:hypothetical protein